MKLPKLTRIHITMFSADGVTYCRCGYSYAHTEWDTTRQSSNSDPRVYRHFIKRWPEIECISCTATLEVYPNA